jgi:hypothetical protein
MDDSEDIEIPGQTDDEPRYLVIGKIDAKCWSAVITLSVSLDTFLSKSPHSTVYAVCLNSFQYRKVICGNIIGSLDAIYYGIDSLWF